VELEDVLMLIGEIEADIWLNISRVEHQIAGLEFDRDRARERSDIAHDAYARVEDQLSRCIEDAASSPVAGR